MDKSKITVNIDNFHKISNVIMSDASIVTSENGGVVYARICDINDQYGAGILIAGSTPVVLYGIAIIIIKLSRRSNYTIPTIFRKLANIIEEIESEV